MNLAWERSGVGDEAGPDAGREPAGQPVDHPFHDVGPSGAGKTTLTRLAARFYDVRAGEVRVGGVDVRDIGTPALMSGVALVFQHVYLVDDTVLANVRLARPDATDEQVREAAAAARLDEVVARLPQGWGTRVGEGGRLLSGGERQRVSLARAFLTDAPIVLLDEVTSALDGENEAAVTRAIHRLAEGRTVLVIAHRLSTIAAADQIVYLEEGRIAEQGTHAELLAAGGRYAGLWAERSQAAAWQLAGRRRAPAPDHRDHGSPPGAGPHRQAGCGKS